MIGELLKYKMHWKKNMNHDPRWVSLTELKLFVLNLGSKTYVAFLNLWDLGGG